VSEAALTQCLAKVRKVVEPSANIQTRHGWRRFVALSRSLPPPSSRASPGTRHHLGMRRSKF
jgi:hypothetical protein